MELNSYQEVTATRRPIIFKQYTDERMRIDSNGTVGINENSPSSSFKLDVGGSANVQGNVHLPTTNRISFGNSDVAAIDGAHGSSGYLKFFVNGNEKARLTPTGRLGIGTDNPVNPLEILGSSADILVYDTDAYSQNSTGAAVAFQGNDSAGNRKTLADIRGVANGSNIGEFAIRTRHTGGTLTEVVRITSAGKIGINKTDPDCALHIAGPASGLMSRMRITCTDSGTHTFAVGADGSGSFQSTINNDRHIIYTTGTQRASWTEHGLCFGTDDAAANGLDDYEEGTFAPMTSTLAEVYHARYTKIGNLVTINTSFEMKSGQSRDHISLPFLPNNDGAGNNIGSNSQTNNRYAGTVSFFDNGVNAVNLMLFHQGNQGSSAYFLSQSSAGTQTWTRQVNDDFGKIGVSFTYQTAS